MNPASNAVRKDEVSEVEVKKDGLHVVAKPEPEHGWGGYDWRLEDGVKVRSIGCLCGQGFADIKTYADHLVDIGRRRSG